MCQAIVKPSGVIIDKATLKRAWQSNPHGAGIAYRIHGKVYIDKGHFRFHDIWKAYRKRQHLDCLIHFRYATHGEQSQANCHPFTLGNSAIIHNGILSNFLPPQGSNKSDTRHFIDSYLAPALAGIQNIHAILSDQSIMRDIEILIGHSKLATLTPQGFVIHNEALGEWHEGAWYSAGYPEDYTEDYAVGESCLSDWWERPRTRYSMVRCEVCNQHIEEDYTVQCYNADTCLECFYALQS